MNIKRFLSILFIAVSFLFLCSFEETDDFFRYEINDKGEAVIIAYAGEMFSENIVIPSEIKGHKVTEIAESAFYGHEYIKSVSIPSTVTKIGEAAFGYCPELSSVTIKNGSDELFIGASAFEGCPMLTNVSFGNRPIYIDDMAFKNCIRLGTVDIGSNITHFGYQAFGGCESLIFNITDNEEAKEHAKENFIPTSFFETDRFLIIVGLASAALILAVILAVSIIIKKRKTQKINK